MDVMTKVVGIILCAIGLVLWCIDYVIFKAIGALTLWIAELAGVTGTAVLGVQIVGWILTASIMICLIVLGVIAIVTGVGLIVEE